VRCAASGICLGKTIRELRPLLEHRIFDRLIPTYEACRLLLERLVMHVGEVSFLNFDGLTRNVRGLQDVRRVATGPILKNRS